MDRRLSGRAPPVGRTPGLDSAWNDLDPWAADVAFARALELLRMHVRHAYDLAEAGAWP
jgi:hypothetical protein